jgi:aspartate/methionine/tyrosine aminotransferase
MQLKPFLLDAWLDHYEHHIDFDLAASTGPKWTVNEILALADEETRHRFMNHKLVYSRPAGADSLREATAEMQHVPVEDVLVMTGASEALVAILWLAAEPGANIIVPLPGYPPFSALAESLGLETRFYRVCRENGFRIDPDEIKRLADSKTKIILVNSPHNPTGATIADEEMEALHDFTAERGIQLVSDEVYHPIYHGRQTRSAARLPHATVIADLSKAFSLAGVRTGWMIEHDARLLLDLEQHYGGNSLGNRNSQTRGCARQGTGGRDSESPTAGAVHGGASRHAWVDLAARRHDRVSLAGERRE